MERNTCQRMHSRILLLEFFVLCFSAAPVVHGIETTESLQHLHIFINMEEVDNVEVELPPCDRPHGAFISFFLGGQQVDVVHHEQDYTTSTLTITLGEDESNGTTDNGASSCGSSFSSAFTPHAWYPLAASLSATRVDLGERRGNGDNNSTLTLQICRSSGYYLRSLEVRLNGVPLVDYNCTVCMINVYYVDWTNGNDTNDGTSPSSAWKTFDKIESSSFARGDAVLLKRGETWNDQLDIDPSWGTTGPEYLPYLIGFYSDSAETAAAAAPLIDGFSTINAGSWSLVPSTGDIYASPWSSDTGEDAILGVVTENGSPLTFLEWNSSVTLDVAQVFNGSSLGSYSYDYDNQTVYVRSTTGNSPADSMVQVAAKLFCVAATPGANNLVVFGVNCRGAAVHGYDMAASKNVVVADADISLCGGAYFKPQMFYLGNGIEFSGDCDGASFEWSVVSDIFDSATSTQTFGQKEAENSLNTAFRHLKVVRAGFSAVELSVLSEVGSAVTGVVIHNVTATEGGQGFSGRRYGEKGEAVSASSPASPLGMIEDVEISECSFEGNFGGVVIRGNVSNVDITATRIVDNLDRGIFVESEAPVALSVSSSVITGTLENEGFAINCPSCSELQLYQNTFKDNGGYNVFFISGPTVPDIRNNIFSSASNFSFLQVYNFSASATQNFNTYYSAATDAIAVVSAGTSFATIESFRTAFPAFAQNSSVGDPLVSSSLVPASNSPAFETGDASLNITTDVNGDTYTNPPNMGALA